VAGEDIFSGDALDRPKLAGIIFNNPEMLETVNHIVHPRVAVDFENWCASFWDRHYVIQEAQFYLKAGHIVLWIVSFLSCTGTGADRQAYGSCRHDS